MWYILIFVITQVDTFVKIHEAVNVRFMNVLAFKLHLNKELLTYKIAGHTQPGDSGLTNGLSPSVS